MSHITKVNLKIRELDDLEVAAEACGLDLRRNQKTHIWYGRFLNDSAEGRAFEKERGRAAMGKCEHALRLKDHRDGDYEIGVIKASDGDGYELSVDTFAQHGRLLKAVGGASFNKLRQEYAAAVATRKAKQQLSHKGFTLSREQVGNRVRLRLVHR